jgi:tetratricopeptide (TPR) repeat protein
MIKDTNDTNQTRYKEKLCKIADNCSEEGNYAKAIKLYLEVLQIDKKTIGVEQLDYFNHQIGLSEIYVKCRKYDAAIKLYREILETFPKFFDTKHLCYLTTLYNLADIYTEKGEDILHLNFICKH